MDVRPAELPEARRILALARKDRRAAEKLLADLPVNAQIATFCEAPAERRAALLELMPEPETLSPLLPEAELCFAVKASGLFSITLEHRVIFNQVKPSLLTRFLTLETMRSKSLSACVSA